MDPRLSHELVSEMLNLCKPPVRRRARPMIRRHDQEKRHATYFPSKASFNSKWNFADDESTWEFSASMAPIARSDSTDTCSSSSSSPAQDIVLRYRVGMPLQAVLSGSSSVSASSDVTDTSWETAPQAPFTDSSSITCDSASSITSEQGPPVPEKDDLKAINRRSRCEALLDTLEEAMDAMKKDGRDENERLVCHRPGCRDTVRDVRALMYHLHIHNIHDESLKCPTCDAQFASSFQMSFHRCQNQDTRLRTPPASPIKDGFFRVLSKISRLPPA
ncbi:hypothetical protein D9615_009721 [Tricholomella constricta]|uniref:Uncharacterized protein n=1 Tax=Tricholomella constricta TaxID=117010 RepID=A0A8H5GT59_9AGAR|nr:hypothetical protein D9615_009721 [Tricholomella constricta]